jgi:hypothetical protein
MAMNVIATTSGTETATNDARAPAERQEAPSTITSASTKDFSNSQTLVDTLG